jgi:hypothetical protein
MSIVDGMKLFGKSKMSKLENIVKALRTRAALLAQKRITAQAALDAAMSARQRHLLEGDADDERETSKLQTRVDSCSSALDGIVDAIGALEGQIGDAERQLAEATEVERRKAAADKVAADVRAVERQIAPWLETSREIAAALREAGVTFEANQLSAFITDRTNEAELAFSVIMNELRAIPGAIISGDRPVPHEPEPVAAVDVIPPPPLVQIFSLNALSWTDHNGKLQRIQKWQDVELSPAQAARAIAAGKAAPPSYPRRFELRGHGGLHPPPAWCWSCDGDDPAPESSATEPITHSAFQTTVGKPYTIDHVEPLPMVATRSITPEK